MAPKSCIIIGAGLGGLAAALRLRAMGLEVTVVEKLPRPGGRCNVIEERGFRVDTGPTILVMKEFFDETYRAVGQELDERISFATLDPNYRIYYHDGGVLELHNGLSKLVRQCEQFEPGVAPRLLRFLADAARKYELAMPFVARNYDHLTDLANPRAAWRLAHTRAYANLYRQAGRYFFSDKLRKAFTFHSMFLGLSPFDSPAMYSLITYADLVGGMHYPLGGIYAIVEDMASLAQEMGVGLLTNAEVAEICIEAGRTRGVRLTDGQRLNADIVVSNADLVYTYEHLIGEAFRGPYSCSRLARLRYACSGYLLYLGVDRTYPQMAHQALYFAADYRANLHAIFRTKTIPEDPSFHLNNPTITDPALAPPGHSILYLLAPMPNLQGDVDWAAAAPWLREKLIDKLESLVDPQIRSHIVWQREYGPPDFARDINAPFGVAFGSLAHGFFQSSYFRPHNVARHIPGLYFVGQATYPGIGMPMVLLSARLLAERLAREGY